MPEGTVKFFHSDAGWGFITPDDGEEDIFVHRTASCLDEPAYLPAGLRVWYTQEWDHAFANWRVKYCTGFKKHDPKSSAARIGGRRCKPTEKLGLNQHHYSKWATSSEGSRARRRAKRHPDWQIDEWEL